MPRDLCPKLLHELLDLDKSSGSLTWKVRTPDHFMDGKSARCPAWRASRWNSRHAGNPALAVNVDGYRKGYICGEVHSAHRVIFAMVTGIWPAGQVDHINGDRSDNRPENLREVTNRQNARNQKRFRTNTSGVSGVVWNKAESAWKARINDDSGRRNLGTYKTKAEAIAARRAAEILVGYSKTHGRRV